MTTRLLVVDDEDDIRLLVRLHLEDAGYSVAEASTADEAQRLLVREEPSVVLLDIRMPDRSGWTVIEELRSTGMLARLPVIVISTQVSDGTAARAIEVGCAGYLKKPFTRSQLLAALDAALGREAGPAIQQG